MLPNRRARSRRWSRQGSTPVTTTRRGPYQRDGTEPSGGYRPRRPELESQGAETLCNRQEDPEYGIDTEVPRGCSQKKIEHRNTPGIDEFLFQVAWYGIIAPTLVQPGQWVWALEVS